MRKVATEKSRSRVYFLHIPKTAGLALLSVLRQWYPESEVCARYDFPRVSEMRRASLLSGHLGRFPLDCVDTTVITMMRHPIDRAISHISHYRSQIAERIASGGWVSDHERAFLDGEIEDLADHPEMSRLLTNVQCRYLGTNLITDEDTLIATDPQREIAAGFEAACRMLDTSIVCLQERYSESIDLLEKAYGCTAYDGARQTIMNAAFGPAPDLSEKGLLKLTKLNEIDLKLYEHAKLRFDALLKGDIPTSFLGRRTFPSTDLTTDPEFSLADLWSTSGFSFREHIPELGWGLWTGASGLGKLNFVYGKLKPARVVIHIVSLLEPQRIQEIKLSINGREVPFRRCVREIHTGKSLFMATIPSEFSEKGRHIEIGIRCPWAQPSQLLNSSDTRFLGALISDIEFLS